MVLLMILFHYSSPQESFLFFYSLIINSKKKNLHFLKQLLYMSAFYVNAKLNISQYEILDVLLIWVFFETS